MPKKCTEIYNTCAALFRSLNLVFGDILVTIVVVVCLSSLMLIQDNLIVNRSINFYCIKVLSTAYVLCSLSLVKLKTEGQTV